MKTYKRECAGLMLAFVGLIGVYAIMTGSQEAIQVLDALATPVMVFAGGAFGIDAWAKQVKT